MSEKQQLKLAASRMSVACALCHVAITYQYENPLPAEKLKADGWLPVIANGEEVFFCPNCRICVAEAVTGAGALHCVNCGWFGHHGDLLPLGSLARLHCPSCRSEYGTVDGVPAPDQKPGVRDSQTFRFKRCSHDRLNEDGVCRRCGADCRGAGGGA